MYTIYDVDDVKYIHTMIISSILYIYNMYIYIIIYIYKDVYIYILHLYIYIHISQTSWGATVSPQGASPEQGSASEERPKK